MVFVRFPRKCDALIRRRRVINAGFESARHTFDDGNGQCVTLSRGYSNNMSHSVESLGVSHTVQCAL